MTDTQHDAETAKARKGVIKDVSELEWHILSADEVCIRLGVSSKSGLDQPMVVRRLQRDGKNVIPPPPSNLMKKIFFAVFGGTFMSSCPSPFFKLSPQVSEVYSSWRASSVSSHGTSLSSSSGTLTHSHPRRPLGDPNPSVANLALAVVLLLVMTIQAVFNMWQGRQIS